MRRVTSSGGIALSREGGPQIDIIHISEIRPADPLAAFRRALADEPLGWQRLSTLIAFTHKED